MHLYIYFHLYTKVVNFILFYLSIFPPIWKYDGSRISRAGDANGKTTGVILDSATQVEESERPDAPETTWGESWVFRWIMVEGNDE